MSLLPAFIKAQKRNADSAPPADAAPALPAADSGDNVFDLVPPRAAETTEAAEDAKPAPKGRNVHPVDMTDLSRLSIDRDGRLYWDGKPVEVHRRILMSRAQVVGASIVAAFVIIGAIGAALQGSAAARDWACRLGWTSSTCTLPGAQPRNRPDIPA